LQTDFENAKVATAQAQRKAGEAQEEVARVELNTQEQHRILELKTAEW